MRIYCDSCLGEGEAGPPDAGMPDGLPACPDCGALISDIDISEHREWIESRVRQHSEMHRIGRIGTRKQSTKQSDADIDRDGIAAELAASWLIAPASLPSYMAMKSGPNRGRDLPRSITGLDLPVEVKTTPYCTERFGFLLVRPPSMTPGRMLTSYIDDALYVLLTGKPYRYRVLGWADRDALIERGSLNPVPIQPGQRECWGIHWSKLFPFPALSGRFASEERASHGR